MRSGDGTSWKSAEPPGGFGEEAYLSEDASLDYLGR